MNLKEKLGFREEPVFLMDGAAFIYRSFYAQRHLRRSDGFPTNALFVLTRVLLRVLKREQPKYFLFAMDGKGKNFRHRLYPEYKANREKMPEELIAQLEPIMRMVDALGIKRETALDVEADDCIASLAWRFSKTNPVVIISGDKDLKQCLSDNILMWDPGSKEEKLVTVDDFKAETGVSPAQWPDMQALIGDSSDNIPGVAGIGPKTAIQIFGKCPNLEAISANIDSLPAKLRDKLLPGLESMYLWRELTTLRRDACPELSLDDLRLAPVNLEEANGLASEYELAAIRREIADLARSSIAEEKRSEPVQAALEPAGVDIKLASEAPDCRGKSVAVIWPQTYEERPRVALMDSSGSIDGDYIWRDTQATLCEWIKNSAALVVADLKTLLVKFPSWLELIEGGYRAFSDLGLACYLLSPEEGDYSWKRISARYRESGAEGSASLALKMSQSLEKALEVNGMTDLYRKLESPLIPVLAIMELFGFAISPGAFQSFLAEAAREADKLESKIYSLAGENFNIRSSRQLAEILFEKMKLPASRKTKGGLASTSQLALEKLASGHEIVDLILRFRRFDKMRSTYLDPLPRLMDKNHRIHTTFNQEATATGRLSSSDPNLQNIPVRGELGQRMRACFVAPPGKLLVAADYSQIELRLLAHFSRDPALLDAFHNGEDIHARTASLVFDTPTDQIMPDQRRMAKTINFGLLYGMGAQKLSQELKISLPQARDFIERYFARLGRIKKFYEDVLKLAREKGFVSTLAGRRRWAPGIYSSNGQEAAQAQRQAINAVIQGSAADVIKLAMIRVANDEFLRSHDAKLTLQVHDELLLEVPENSAEECARVVCDIMRSANPGQVSLSVPLLVDWGIGPNWSVAH